MGIDVLTPFEQKSDLKRFGDFVVQNFELTDLDGNPTHTNGDGSPCRCFGYLISHREFGRLLYITDTQLIKYRFKSINHVLLGVNYSMDDLKISDEDATKKIHCYGGHLSVEAGKEFIRITSENCPMLQNVMLCHLSGSNADSEYFISQFSEVANKANVCVMHRGLEREL